MTNTTSGINKEIRVNRQRLETVRIFTYLRSVVSYEGSKPEILSRIVQTTAALTRLKSVWNSRSISLIFKIRLMRSLVTSIFLYACESCTPTNELQRTRGMEVRSCCKILRISYKDHVNMYGHVFLFISSGQNHLARHSDIGTEYKAGRKGDGKRTSGNF